MTTFSFDTSDAALAHVEAMEAAVMAGDRERAKRYLSAAVRYRIGSRPGVEGIEEVFGAVATQSVVVQWTGHTLVGHWLHEDVLIVEVVSHFRRVRDGRAISFPCTDIYRFHQGKIADWRVFADMSPLFAD